MLTSSCFRLELQVGLGAESHAGSASDRRRAAWSEPAVIDEGTVGTAEVNHEELAVAHVDFQMMPRDLPIAGQVHICILTADDQRKLVDNTLGGLHARRLHDAHPQARPA